MFVLIVNYLKIYTWEGINYIANIISNVIKCFKNENDRKTLCN